MTSPSPPPSPVELCDESSITTDWLETVLQSYYNSIRIPADADASVGRDDQSIQVSDFRVQPGCEEGENLLSDLLAIDVELVDGRRLHLMAKLLSQDPFCRHFIVESGFDVREILFYTALVPALNDLLDKTPACQEEATPSTPAPAEDDPAWPAPLCYYAKYRSGTDSILVLDNVKARGYAMADFGAGLTLDEAVAAVRAVARFHAAGLAYRLQPGVGADLLDAFPFLFRPEAAAESYQQLLERGLPQLASFLHRSERPELHQVLVKLHKLRPQAKDTIAELLRPDSAISTLTHTDFWCNNLLFRRRRSVADNVEQLVVDCCIVDWQMVTFSRPTNDLALLLVTSVAGDVRRAHTDQVLDAYWRALNGHCRRLGVDLAGDRLRYTEADLRSEYDRSLLLAVLLGIGSVDLALGRPDTEQRLCQLLLDLSADGVF